ncbi:MAG TPA: guanylate kinase [Terriglobales bacterium]|jgi:guanylate kinase|nr:guanylate kinase [Terriglobales bacterium]
MSRLVYIISAPSGSGKSTLVNELRKSVKHLDFSISYTTRNPRGSEQNGREYFFVTREQFETMIDRDEFLEHAEVFGNYYGTARKFLQEAQARGNDLLLDIDVQGERLIKRKLPEAISIFILPPSRSELEKRLRRRSQAEGVNSDEVIQRRLNTASKEIANYPNYDYILVNDDLEHSIDQLRAIVHYERGKRSGAAQDGDQEWQSLRKLAEECLQANVRPRLAPILASFAI